MKKFLLLFCLMALGQSAFAQLDCEEQLPMRIIADAGLNMRSRPSLRAAVVVTVPYDKIITACRNTEGRMTYDGITGYWRQCSYSGKTGYLFDGYMELSFNSRQPAKETAVTSTEKEASGPEIETVESTASNSEASNYQFVTEAYNYCGEIKNLDPGLLWYGFYPAQIQRGEEHYRIEPVELNVVLSKAKLGSGMEFDIETNREERSIFLLGLNRPLDFKALDIDDQSERLRYTGRKVFPGQELDLGNGLKLSATGSVEKSGPCPQLKNYHLTLSGSGFEQEVTSIIPKGQCGMPELYWYGDFSGDGIPEVIFVSVYEEKNHFSLLMSENTNSKQLLHLQAEWVIDKCY